MAYTTINKSSDFFNTLLYTGNGSTNAITGVGFQPDMCWWKMRSGIEEHALGDAVRGAGYIVKPNSTSAQAQSASYFSSFDSDGFTLGSDDKTNKNTSTYASWNWKANGQGSSNTDGTINSTYTSASATSGFSIIKYTGTGANATVGHGLGVAPKMVMVKQTNTTRDWAVYHKFSNPDGTGAQYYMHLNNSDARASNSAFWNNTDPTSSVIHLGSNHNTNGSGGTYIAYCFADTQGFSKIGYYTGNANANGSFIYTGFKPAFVMVKNASSTNHWIVLDNKREGYNPQKYALFPNQTNAETGDYLIDFTSSGFKVRTATGALSENGETLIYMAFAEAPLVGSNNVPATAR